MAIEFRCTECNKLLRTGDDTAGKQAKCPECGAVVNIPAGGAASVSGGANAPPPQEPFGSSGSPFGPGGPIPEPGGDPQNPYRSPGASGGPAFQAAQPGVFSPTRIQMEDIYGRTWTIFKQQWGACLLALIVVWAISFVVNIVVGFGLGFAGAMSRDQTVAAICSVVSNIITTAFGIWLGIGQALYFLKIARGQPAELGEIFSGGPYFLRVLGASILFGLAYFAGVLLCVVPGVIFALMFSQFYYLILDRNVGVMESLNISRDIMNGNKMTLFLIGLIGVVAGLALVVVTCGLGLLAVGPFFSLLAAVTYLAITGQPTADQMMYRPPTA